MSNDMYQQVPLLSGVGTKDPYSMQISFVFPSLDRFQKPGFQKLALQTIREETPAHLTPRICWLDQTAMTQFKTAYVDWQDKLRRYATEAFSTTTTA